MHRRWRWLVPFTALLATAVTRAGATAAPQIHDPIVPESTERRIDRAAQRTTVRALAIRKDRARAKARASSARLRQAKRIADSAAAQIGDAYAWGGGGPDAFDCSGLTRWAFATAGVSLPHDSHAQAGAGRPVERDDIRAGDLVFFSTAGPGASHVGVATSSSSVVSATNSGVLEHPLDDAYWGGHYVSARRVR